MVNYKILISQARPQSERNPYSDLESKHGVTMEFMPLQSIEGLSAREFRQQRINMQDYTAVLVNSRLAIDHFFRLAAELRFQVPEEMHYYCISEAVGNYLTKYIQYRKRRIFFGATNKFEELLPAMNRRPNEKYMMVMSETSSNDVIEMFADHHIAIQPAVMYRTVEVEWPHEKPFDYQMLVLFTPTAVQAIRKNFPDWKQGDTVIACFGQNTLQAAEEAGWNVQIKAPSPEYPSITAAIDAYLSKIG